MKKIKLILFLLLFTTFVQGQISKLNQVNFQNNISKWFNAWELVSKETYGLNTLKPIDFVFFDEKYIYTTSQFVGKKGDIIKGPKNLLDKKFTWYKIAYKDSISLPDGQKRKAEIMCFTIPIYNNKESNAYFVMPLINYWKLKNPGDHKIGYEKLTTAVFIHEFCHSQQLENGQNGMEEKAFEQYFTAHPNEVYMDDIMQDIYSKDIDYEKIFKKELDLFTNAFESKSKNDMISNSKMALNIMRERQKFILDRDKRDLSEIDNYWLTLEGVAQFSSFMWLINPKGGNLTIENALKAGKTNSWSQEEGFAIAYLYSKLSEPKKWANNMFRSKTIDLIELLKIETEKK